MSSALRIANCFRGCVLLLSIGASPLLSQQAPTPSDQQGRDLTRVEDNAKPTDTAKVNIPRSYALVVGIASYKKLAAKAQLQFSSRDAEDIYTTLISKEGGNFPAQNVHKLINDAATLAESPPRIGRMAAICDRARRPSADLLRGPWLYLRRQGLSCPLRRRPRQDWRHRPSDGGTGSHGEHQDPRQVEGADHRCVS